MAYPEPSEFPAFESVEFQPIKTPKIKTAPFQFTDPIQYAKQAATANLEQMQTNFGVSRDWAMQALDAELQGLRGYVPAIAALKREQISVDNAFNTWQRGQQVNTALPEAAGDLAAQRKRAQAYASGRLPDEMTDRALMLGTASRAADTGHYAGFGAKSLQTMKLSDLMSAEQRFQIGQYGEQLTGANLQTKANLFLPPTEYSDVGTQVKVMPEVGAGRLTYQGLGTINSATIIPPGAMLESTIQQREYSTNLEQRTREFNANMQLQASTFNSSGALQAGMFNSQGEFTAGLGAFNYEVGLAANTEAQNQQIIGSAINSYLQGSQGGAFQAGVSGAQGAQDITSGASGIAALPGYADTINSILTTGSGTGTQSSQGDVVAPIEGGTLSPKTLSSPSQVVSSMPAASYEASAPGAIQLPSGSSIPAGYVSVGTGPSGSTVAVSEDSYKGDLERFARASNIPQTALSVRDLATADRVLSTNAGLSYVPVPGFRQMALTGNGKPVYSHPEMATSGDIGAGAANLTSVAMLMAGFGIKDPGTYETFARMASVASDPEFLSHLDRMYEERGPQAVSTMIGNQIGGWASSQIKPGSPQAVQSALANRVGEMWGSFSPKQKSLALASFAIPGVESKTGKAIVDHTVPGSEGAVGGALKVGQLMDVAARGMNAGALARNWKSLSALGAVAAGSTKPDVVAATAQAAGLLGYGPQGASVPVEKGALRALGARPEPTLGVGATSFSSAKHLPPHYSAVGKTTDGRVVAVPANLKHTIALTSPLSHEIANQVAKNRHPVQRTWGEVKTRGIRGSAGGSALVSGLNTMQSANPALAGAMAAHALYRNVIGRKRGN